jgi:hypothetical protein
MQKMSPPFKLNFAVFRSETTGVQNKIVCFSSRPAKEQGTSGVEGHGVSITFSENPPI